MRLTPTILADVLYRTAHKKSKAQIISVVHQFVALLEKKGALMLLPKILEKIPAVSAEHEGVQLVSMESARQLSEKMQQTALHYVGLSPERAHITQIINPDLIAGVRIRTVEKLCDASLRGRLDTLRHAFHR